MERLKLPNVTAENIVKTLNNLGYPFNEDLFRLNIVGIRANTPIYNSFCDYMAVVWRDDQGRKSIVTTCTTIPGLTYLKDELGNPDGTAIVKPGYYPKIWQIGEHKGYQALTQFGTFKVYRDKLLDGVIEYDESTVQDAYGTGIDFHRASPDHVNQRVDNFSAACQVLNDPAIFQKIMDLANLQIYKTQFKTFDYALVRESDVLAIL